MTKKYKIVRGKPLELVAEALMEMGDNRLPVETSERVVDAAQVVLAALNKRQEMHAALAKPYLTDGKQDLKPEDEGYAELLDKLNTLYAQEIELDLGKPICTSDLKGASIRPNLLGVLKDLGWVK